jgi:putative endonuclease
MATLYILHSQKLNRFYTGSCLDLSHRLEEHLQGKYQKSFTKKAEDWVIYLRVDDLNYDVARKMENHIKKMKSKKYMENLKAYPELLQKLINSIIQAGSSR